MPSQDGEAFLRSQKSVLNGHVGWKKGEGEMAGWTNIGKKRAKGHTHHIQRRRGEGGNVHIYRWEGRVHCWTKQRKRGKEREREERERERERERVKARMVYCTLFDPGGRRAQTSISRKKGRVVEIKVELSTPLDSTRTRVYCQSSRSSSVSRIGGESHIWCWGDLGSVGKKRDCWSVPK